MRGKERRKEREGKEKVGGRNERKEEENERRKETKGKEGRRGGKEK